MNDGKKGWRKEGLYVCQAQRSALSIMHNVWTVLPHLTAGALWLRELVFPSHTQPESDLGKIQTKLSDPKPHTFNPHPVGLLNP